MQPFGQQDKNEASFEVPLTDASSKNPIKRNLSTILNQSKKMLDELQKKAQPEAKTSFKGDLLLTTKGFDVDQYKRSIREHVPLFGDYEPTSVLSATDIEEYLKHEQQLLILQSIEEAKVEVMTIFLFFCQKFTHQINNSLSNFFFSRHQICSRKNVTNNTKKNGLKLKILCLEHWKICTNLQRRREQLYIMKLSHNFNYQLIGRDSHN